MASLLLGMILLYSYASYTGWKIFNSDEVENVSESKGRTHHSGGGRSRFYHK
ncbi:MAG: hypothetical protein MUC81_10170 [Bacteroidia bacterium]|nr:hypothetical protein [Bacteroidia bacterium]